MTEKRKRRVKTEEVKTTSNKCLLISRLDYPVNVEYGNEIIRVSPRSKHNVDTSKLKELPNGIFTKI